MQNNFTLYDGVLIRLCNPVLGFCVKLAQMVSIQVNETLVIRYPALVWVTLVATGILFDFGTDWCNSLKKIDGMWTPHEVLPHSWNSLSTKTYQNIIPRGVDRRKQFEFTSGSLIVITLATYNHMSVTVINTGTGELAFLTKPFIVLFLNYVWIIRIHVKSIRNSVRTCLSFTRYFNRTLPHKF